ncbi:hypothetical protein F5Y05DRAFT_418479 [Hypoxylon sp. FL0543]|nr:hypothetical protein F5Y05DRAFT_418479 [Hypoxylon sp. FL0543]
MPPSLFKGCVIALAAEIEDGWNSRNVSRWTKQNGGTFSRKVDKKVTHVLATAEQCDEEIPAIIEAIEYNTHIVTTDWFADSLHESLKQNEKIYSLNVSEKAKKRRETRKKGIEDGKNFINRNLNHIYQDETLFPYEVTITRNDEESGKVGEKYVLYLWESNAKPHLYHFMAKKYYKEPRNKTAIYRPRETPRTLEPELAEFKRFFHKKCGIDWDDRIAKAGTTPKGKFQYQPPTGGKPVGLLKGEIVEIQATSGSDGEIAANKRKRQDERAESEESELFIPETPPRYRRRADAESPLPKKMRAGPESSPKLKSFRESSKNIDALQQQKAIPSLSRSQGPPKTAIHEESPLPKKMRAGPGAAESGPKLKSLRETSKSIDALQQQMAVPSLSRSQGPPETAVWEEDPLVKQIKASLAAAKSSPKRKSLRESSKSIDALQQPKTISSLSRSQAPPKAAVREESSLPKKMRAGPGAAESSPKLEILGEGSKYVDVRQQQKTISSLSRSQGPSKPAAREESSRAKKLRADLGIPEDGPKLKSLRMGPKSIDALQQQKATPSLSRSQGPPKTAVREESSLPRGWGAAVSALAEDEPAETETSLKRKSLDEHEQDFDLRRQRTVEWIPSAPSTPGLDYPAEDEDEEALSYGGEAAAEGEDDTELDEYADAIAKETKTIKALKEGLLNELRKEKQVENTEDAENGEDASEEGV